MLREAYNRGLACGLEAAATVAKLYPTAVADGVALTPEQRAAVAEASENIADMIEELLGRLMKRGGR
jgi:hypothetical protein